jgi:hypothetical protein
MRQLTTLDAQFLAVESARTYGHVGSLAILRAALAELERAVGIERASDESGAPAGSTAA